MAPMENLQCQALRDHGRPDLLPLVPRYNAFLLLLGMVRPMQVDGVRDRKGLLYNPYIPLATTRRTHSTKFCRVFACMIVLCFRGVFEGA